MVKPKSISNFKEQHRAHGSFWTRWLADKRIFAIIALIFLLLILIPLAKNYSHKRLIEKEIEDIQAEISDFEAKNGELKEMIDYLQSDQSLEEQARLNMGLKRPGETVAVIQENAGGVPQASEAIVEEISNWRKWWQYFAD